jgi:hypothetical protein
MLARAAILALLTLALTPASSGALADKWCGTQTTSNNTDVTNAPRVKYVYAYPSDQPNRFDDVKDLMQADAKRIADNYSAASGGRKTLRWDVGTSCGNDYVDIEVVQLPGTQADYEPNTNAHIARIRADLRAAIDPAPGRRDYAVIADHTRLEDNQGHAVDPNSVLGITESADDDSVGLGNTADRGDRIAIAFGGTSFTGQVLPGALMHELLHAFGAVSNSAPHSNKFGHVTDGKDILGTGSAAECPTTPIGGGIDCNQDDYFNPAPAPGSYLATHWNVFDVVFLVPPDQVGAQAAPPVAKLTHVVNTYVLDASGSTDPDGVIVRYEWDLHADGTYDATTTTPQYTYNPQDADSFRVRVTDEDGLTAVSDTIAYACGCAAPPPDVLLFTGTRSSQKLKDALKKGVLAYVTSTTAGKVKLTLYKGKKRLKSVTVTVTAGKKTSKRIKLSSRIAKKYLKRKKTYEIRATLGSRTAKQKVKLK